MSLDEPALEKNNKMSKKVILRLQYRRRHDSQQNDIQHNDVGC